MKVKVLKVEQAEGRSERATVELRNGVVLQVRSSECADLGTPQAEAALAEDSGKPSTREGDEKVKVRLHGLYEGANGLIITLASLLIAIGVSHVEANPHVFAISITSDALPPIAFVCMK